MSAGAPFIATPFLLAIKMRVSLGTRQVHNKSFRASTQMLMDRSLHLRLFPAIAKPQVQLIKWAELDRSLLGEPV